MQSLHVLNNVKCGEWAELTEGIFYLCTDSEPKYLKNIPKYVYFRLSQDAICRI